MSQSKSHSVIEAVVNVTFGFILSWGVWWLVAAPLFGIPFDLAESFWITTLFTVVSLIRSYIFRRIFNWVTMKTS